MRPLCDSASKARLPFIKEKKKLFILLDSQILSSKSVTKTEKEEEIDVDKKVTHHKYVLGLVRAYTQFRIKERTNDENERRRNECIYSCTHA